MAGIADKSERLRWRVSYWAAPDPRSRCPAALRPLAGRTSCAYTRGMSDFTAAITGPDAPIALTTAPGSSAYTMHRDGEILVCQVGSTKLTYQLRAVQDLYEWLSERGDWVPLGGADENKPAADGSVEAFGRDETNPVGGWYGLRRGYRGRFGVYLPPLLEHLGVVELEHGARNNRVRALPSA